MHCSVGSVGAQNSGTLITGSIRSLSRPIIIFTCTCTCTCMLMSGEADALNAHILLLKLVESVLESIGGRCFNDMLRKLIPVPHDSLGEKHSTDTTRVPCLKQF